MTEKKKNEQVPMEAPESAVVTKPASDVSVVEEKTVKEKPVVKKIKKTTKSKSQEPRVRKRGKKYREIAKKVDSEKFYSIEEGVKLALETSFVTFDASVELHIKLGVDPKKQDQQVRGTIVLPHGTGKTKKILAFVDGDDIELAKTAGADYVGSEEFIDKIKKGWLDFDVVVATPKMMKVLAPLGKTLGTKGLMPNPKAGTVTTDVTKTIEELKKGRVEYKLEKQPIIHTMIGKVSFGDKKIAENLKVFVRTILRAKPSASKGVYFQSCFITTAMGPSVRLDVSELRGL